MLMYTDMIPLICFHIFKNYFNDYVHKITTDKNVFIYLKQFGVIDYFLSECIQLILVQIR